MFRIDAMAKNTFKLVKALFAERTSLVYTDTCIYTKTTIHTYFCTSGS